MKISTLSNLIQLCVFALLGVCALTGAIFCNAWWHYFTAAACFIFARMLYTDDQYGIESVRTFVHRKLGK